MARVVYFNNRKNIEPGVYTTSKGGEPIAPDSASFGNIAIIDNGIGAGYGSGSGISGEVKSSKKSIQSFSDLDSFRDFARGGVLYDVAELLFKPSRDNTVRGAQNLFFIKAAVTTRAAMTFTFTGGGAAGGEIEVSTLDEGLSANGTIESTKLIKGYAGKMVAGVDDTDKFKIEFYLGQFGGAAADGYLYAGVSKADSEARFLIETPEFDNVQELVDWMTTDSEFKRIFELTDSTVTGTGVVDSDDLTSNASLNAATGGTETYSSDHLDTVLESITELDNTIFLCDKFGVTDGKGAENNKILAHIELEAVQKKLMVVGGGKDDTEFDQSGASSIDIASSFDNGRVFVVHGDIYRQINFSNVERRYDTFYHAAAFCGRIAGLEPQVPATRRDLNVSNVEHDMTLKERNKAIQAGVVHLKQNNSGDWVINQEITSLQNNTQQIYPNGQSPEGQIMRISSNLEKFIDVNLENYLDNSRRNVNSVSSEDLRNKLQGLLLSQSVSQNNDGYIKRSFDLKVDLIEGDYHASYGYEVNGPINRIFVTSVIFSPKN